MAEPRTYTEAELAQIKQEASDAAFKKGLEKAKANLEASKGQADTEAKLKRLQELEAKEAERAVQAELNETIEALKADELKDTGLKTPAVKRFATEHKDTLKGLTGEALASKVKELRESANEDDKTLFFDNADVNASGSLSQAAQGGEKETGYEYLPGSSIKIKK